MMMMMIEIEFRAKSIDGEWVYGSLVQNEYWTEIWVYHREEGQETFHNVDKNTIGQYTRKRDENAKKIYTGDIVHNGERAMEVIFHNSAFRVLAQGHDRNNAMTIYEASQKWILNKIGNVHDNPELLNV